MRTLTKQLLMATAVTAGISGIALAKGDGGDNSMSPGYVDSWAFFRAGAVIAARSAKAQKAQATMESSTPALRILIVKVRLKKDLSKTFDE